MEEEVVEEILPTFEEPPEPQIFLTLEATPDDWSYVLPEFSEYFENEITVKVEMPSQLENIVDFNEKERTFSLVKPLSEFNLDIISGSYNCRIILTEVTARRRLQAEEDPASFIYNFTLYIAEKEEFLQEFIASESSDSEEEIAFEQQAGLEEDELEEETGLTQEDLESIVSGIEGNVNITDETAILPSFDSFNIEMGGLDSSIHTSDDSILIELRINEELLVLDIAGDENLTLAYNPEELEVSFVQGKSLEDSITLNFSDEEEFEQFVANLVDMVGEQMIPALIQTLDPTEPINMYVTRESKLVLMMCDLFEPSEEFISMVKERDPKLLDTFKLTMLERDN